MAEIQQMLKHYRRKIGGALGAIGVDPKKLASFWYLPRYIIDRTTFKRAGGKIDVTYAIFDDYSKKAGNASGHYFHQDLLVAKFIKKANPRRHIDVGSRIDGFVAHVASFRKIEVIDIRPLDIKGHSQITFVQGDLMALDDALLELCDSISCLHALEHFGLGRYNDPIDPNGHIKGFFNLYRMLKPGGTLYVSFPIGLSEVHFNAHRVFEPSEILDWAKDLFELIRFDYVDDDGNLHLDTSILSVPRISYGCGIYTLKKISTHSSKPM